MATSLIYLDNNATTAADPRVIDLLTETLRRGPANASSLHRGGQQAAGVVSDAITCISRCLGVPLNVPGAARIIFTSGGTESNNTAIVGIRPQSPLLISQIEHPSIIAAAESVQQRGRSVRTIAVHRDGTLDLDSLAEELRRCSMDQPDHPPVVAVMSANNETGVVQPIRSVAEHCQRHAAHLHIDATQTIGKLPTDLSSLAFGSLTMAAHKFHGPPGIGGLILAAGVHLDPLVVGGGQQLESRGGTEPVALIAAMAEALRLCTDDFTGVIANMRRQRDRLESALQNCDRRVVVQGRDADRLPNTTCVSMVGADRQNMLMALDIAGVAASSGSACSSGSSPPSHVLLAMKRDEPEVASALRFGVSRMTTDDEIESAIDIIGRCYRRLAQRSGNDGIASA